MPLIASCQCQGFQVEVDGKPDFTNICHCLDCQRRTGSHVSSNAYFLKENTRILGEHRLYTRNATKGRQLHNYFCPTCGSTVCWTLDLRPQYLGVAIGCFNDCSFAAPRISLWEDRMYPWTILPDGMERFAQMRPRPDNTEN